MDEIKINQAQDAINIDSTVALLGKKANKSKAAVMLIDMARH